MELLKASTVDKREVSMGRSAEASASPKQCASLDDRATRTDDVDDYEYLFGYSCRYDRASPYVSMNYNGCQLCNCGHHTGASRWQAFNIAKAHNRLVGNALPKFRSNCSRYGERGCILPTGCDMPGRAGLGSTTSYTGLAKGGNACNDGACSVLISYDVRAKSRR